MSPEINCFQCERRISCRKNRLTMNFVLFVPRVRIFYANLSSKYRLKTILASFCRSETKVRRFVIVSARVRILSSRPHLRMMAPKSGRRQNAERKRATKRPHRQLAAQSAPITTVRFLCLYSLISHSALCLLQIQTRQMTRQQQQTQQASSTASLMESDDIPDSPVTKQRLSRKCKFQSRTPFTFSCSCCLAVLCRRRQHKSYARTAQWRSAGATNERQFCRGGCCHTRAAWQALGVLQMLTISLNYTRRFSTRYRTRSWRRF